MHSIRLLAALLIISLGTLAAACDGDDDDGTSPTDGTTATATATATADDDSPTPTEGGGNGNETTPPDEKTPIGTGGDNGENGAATPTFAGTPAPMGTPAVHIPDIGAWLNENYPGVSPQETDCVYNPGTVIATCDGVQYAVDPPLGGQDIQCFALRVDGEAVAIRCTSQDPLTTIYYEIQG